MAEPLIYPDSLPCPRMSDVQARERRLLSPQAGVSGPMVCRVLQRDLLQREQVSWTFTFAQAEVFRLWWRDVLIYGGNWFGATWPLPQGVPDGGMRFRRFVGAPTWADFIPGVGWGVSAVMEVRGLGTPEVIDSGAEVVVCGWLLSETNSPPNPFVLTNGNRTAAIDDVVGGSYAVEGGVRRGSGKRYVEIVLNERHSDDSAWGGIGLASAMSDGMATGFIYNVNGVASFGSSLPSFPALAAGDVVGLAVDWEANGFDDDGNPQSVGSLPPGYTPAMTLWVSLNGVWLDGDPATGTDPTAVSYAYDYFPFAYRTYAYPISVTMNAAAGVHHAAPEGFTAWSPSCTEGPPPDWFNGVEVL